MRTIRVICPNTIFGRIEKTFYTEAAAFKWMRICAQNQVEFTVDYPQ